MATKKKLLQAAAGQAGGEALNVEEVFSTYLYQGTSANQSITNGIDLDGEGGLVWVKGRPNAGYSHGLYDTERGVTKRLASNETTAESTYANSVTAFNNNGFSLGSDANGEANFSGSTYASWTFRKAPKFFDVVTYTGDGSSNRSVSHNLGSTPGFFIIKRTDASQDWFVAARNNSGSYYYDLNLNTTDAAQGPFDFVGSASYTMDASAFALDIDGASNYTNISGATYIAYLFAHNDSDGEFGPDADLDAIKCGSYTGTGSSGNFVDLGFEPQFMLIKNTSSSANWIIHDNMRGMIESTGNVLFPNLNSAENTTAFRQARPNATGITFFDGNSETNGSGSNYIYIAIRRGPMAVPEDADDVFAIDYGGNGSPAFISNFVTDAALVRNPSAASWNYLGARLQGAKTVRTNSTDAESTEDYSWDYMNGAGNTWGSSYLAWMWRRAPSFCDVVAYTGNGTGTRTLSHNLEATPEMIWLKKRSTTSSWYVYHKDLSDPNNGYVELNSSDGRASSSGLWGTGPTSTNFQAVLNTSGQTHIAYLFASLDGVSKVGSYTGTGSGGHQIDCGFTNGARFVLSKRTDQSSWNWILFDSERGIVAGNDPFLALNDTSAEVTSLDLIDPYSAGFELASNAGGTNASGGSYIFYAIA